LQEFTNWTVKTIREDKYIGSWMEERKFDWIPLVSKTISNVIDNSKTILVISDEKRDWLLKYILININKDTNLRPLLPILDFNCISHDFKNISLESNIELIRDMLDIAFPNGYIFWYIGKSHNKKAVLPKMSNNSFLWLLDENVPNSFFMKSADEALDMKFLQLYRLFDKTLNAVLFAQIAIDK
jgi:hypothetical protein